MAWSAWPLAVMRQAPAFPMRLCSVHRECPPRSRWGPSTLGTDRHSGAESVSQDTVWDQACPACHELSDQLMDEALVNFSEQWLQFRFSITASLQV